MNTPKSFKPYQAMFDDLVGRLGAVELPSVFFSFGVLVMNSDFLDA